MSVFDYDTWKLAYPPEWDKEEPEDDDEQPYWACNHCGESWAPEDHDPDSGCPHCDSTDIELN